MVPDETPTHADPAERLLPKRTRAPAHSGVPMYFTFPSSRQVHPVLYCTHQNGDGLESAPPATAPRPPIVAHRRAGTPPLPLQHAHGPPVHRSTNRHARTSHPSLSEHSCVAPLRPARVRAPAVLCSATHPVPALHTALPVRASNAAPPVTTRPPPSTRERAHTTALGRRLGYARSSTIRQSTAAPIRA